jgi:hypothetical protein
MVILHVRVEPAEDRFLVESRCTEQTGRVVQLVSETYALRLQLRELLALHRAPPADVANVLTEAAVRAKQLLALDALAGLAERLAAELAADGVAPPPPPPAADVCASLAFAQCKLLRDKTPLPTALPPSPAARASAEVPFLSCLCVSILSCSLVLSIRRELMSQCSTSSTSMSVALASSSSSLGGGFGLRANAIARISC